MSEYRSPQQEPGSERRLLLVFAITMLALLALQPLINKYLMHGTPAAPPPSAPQQAQAVPAPSGPVVPQARQVKGGKQAGSETETVIESDVYRMVFTNKGGLVKSWVLKKYRDENGKPLELVNSIAAQSCGYPLSLYTYDPNLRSKLNSVLYVPSATGTLHAPADLTFEYSDGTTAVRKSFHFDNPAPLPDHSGNPNPLAYVLKVTASATDRGQAVAAYPWWPGGFGDQTGPISYAKDSIDWLPGQSVDRLAPKKVSNGATLRQPFYWAGTVDQYFAAVFLPDDPSSAVLVTSHNEIDIPKNPQKPEPNDTTKVAVLGAAAGSALGPASLRMFVGPKAVDLIEAIKASPMGGATPPTLSGLADFGTYLGFIAKPLFLWLQWTQKHWIHNWGWAIAFLTLVINLALLPLRVTSMKSALKMQRVQPMVNDIKEKYRARTSKLDSRDAMKKRELNAQMNQETMALMKQHGVNPAGGCLPLVIQMPFLIAFWTMLGATIELRQAPWLWIKDLASPDPYHVLPILIVASTWAMQQMTPQPGIDPNQRKMMNFMMPIMLGFFSWSYASGLSVYWLVGTVIGVVQQLVMNRTALGQEMRATAEKRARKRREKVGK